MFLNRNKNGFNWYNAITKNKKGEKVFDQTTGKPLTLYMHYTFAKGADPSPQELGEYGSYEGELFFRDTTGAERQVIPYIDEYHKQVTLLLLKKQNEYNDPQPSWQPKTEAKWDLRPNEISEDDLPFDE